MAHEHAEDSTLINASRDAILEAALDFPSYPVWARSIRSAVVKEKDSEGRGRVVAFEVGALGRRVHYTLRFDYSELPHRYTWVLVEGDPRAVDGYYRFAEMGSHQTRVTYSLGVDLGFPLPRFIMRRAERLILSMALKELKAYVES